MDFFLYGIFIGVAAATRRNDHLYLAVLAESMTGNTPPVFRAVQPLVVVLCVALCMVYFGYLNLLDGFNSLRMPSMTPMATSMSRSRSAARWSRCSPSSRWSTAGATAFPTARRITKAGSEVAVTGNGLLIALMGFLFLFFGYMGVPVAFALIASVLLVTMFTPVSEASMIAQIFNGMDVEALLAVPFFLLVGDLMTSAKSRCA